MYPVINLWGLELGSYGVLTVLGLACAVVVCTLLGRRKGADFYEVLLMMLVAGGGILVGGHLLYGITRLYKLPAALDILSNHGFIPFCVAIGILFGGMVFYGGFLGSVAAMGIYTHYYKKLPRRLCMDLLAVATPLFHAFGRVGCFLAGCCYGAEAEWGILVQENPINPAMAGVPRIPISLYEALCNLLIFGVLLLLFLRRKEGSFPLLGAYVLLYGPTRFVTEMFRGDEIRGAFLWFTTSQWISLILFAVGAVALALHWRKKAKLCKPLS